MPNTNNLLAASLDQQQQQQTVQSSFDMENALWYNQFSYNEDPCPPSWNTPASTCSTSAPSSMPGWPLPETVTSQTSTSGGGACNSTHSEQDFPDHRRDTALIMGSSSNTLETSGMSKASKGQRENDSEVKLRPPPPLLAKGSPRMPIKSSSSNNGNSGSTNNSSSTAKRPELEVRKDLTLPTAPTGILNGKTY